ncbi:MAG: hypothetical protein IRZ03_17825 [Acidobacterium ailaaui]|nr:hypothetical protein [Pseudacidobacterium ailaaui]
MNKNKEIIYRLSQSDIDENYNVFNYDENKPIYKQWLELSSLRYFERGSPQFVYRGLHIYRANIFKFIAGERKILISIPFNFVNRHYLYIDYLYYSSVINELNFIIFINKKYLIDLDYIGIKDSATVLSIKDNDPRYNKNTYKAIDSKIFISKEYISRYIKN